MLRFLAHTSHFQSFQQNCWSEQNLSGHFTQVPIPTWTKATHMTIVSKSLMKMHNLYGNVLHCVLFLKSNKLKQSREGAKRSRLSCKNYIDVFLQSIQWKHTVGIFLQIYQLKIDPISVPFIFACTYILHHILSCLSINACSGGFDRADKGWHKVSWMC